MTASRLDAKFGWSEIGDISPLAPHPVAVIPLAASNCKKWRRGMRCGVWACYFQKLLDSLTGDYNGSAARLCNTFCKPSVTRAMR